jgi:hypothetical protein
MATCSAVRPKSRNGLSASINAPVLLGFERLTELILPTNSGGTIRGAFGFAVVVVVGAGLAVVAGFGAAVVAVVTGTVAGGAVVVVVVGAAVVVEDAGTVEVVGV